MKKVSSSMRCAFRLRVLGFYKRNGRNNLPWRHTDDPYAIFVSEIMLQQTQVSRVIPKYNEFIKKFPNIFSLCRAHVKDVLRVWSGLGYNRRALMLLRAAHVIVERYGGTFPSSREELEKIPGIGRGTSGALMAFAFQKPEPFIETNIRRVFLFHFFSKKKTPVRDDEILSVVAQTIDKKNPREWYYALMDYGAWLGKQTKENPNRKSAIYKKQEKFHGSNREIRGYILKQFLAGSPLSYKMIAKRFHTKIDRIATVVTALEKEGLLQ